MPKSKLITRVTAREARDQEGEAEVGQKHQYGTKIRFRTARISVTDRATAAIVTAVASKSSS